MALHPYLRHSEYQHIHRMDDTYFKGNFRDVMYPQIEYITQRYNDCCGCAWEHCRCLPNITRLSAWRVDCRDLQEGEVCRIQCHYKQPPDSGILSHIPLPSPVERTAVVGVEQRPEFVVIPISEGRTPMLARRPRLFYGQKTDVYEAEVTIKSIRDSERY